MRDYYFPGFNCLVFEKYVKNTLLDVILLVVTESVELQQNRLYLTKFQSPTNNIREMMKMVVEIIFLFERFDVLHIIVSKYCSVCDRMAETQRSNKEWYLPPSASFP